MVNSQRAPVSTTELSSRQTSQSSPDASKVRSFLNEANWNITIRNQLSLSIIQRLLSVEASWSTADIRLVVVIPDGLPASSTSFPSTSTQEKQPLAPLESSSNFSAASAIALAAGLSVTFVICTAGLVIVKCKGTGFFHKRKLGATVVHPFEGTQGRQEFLDVCKLTHSSSCTKVQSKEECMSESTWSNWQSPMPSPGKSLLQSTPSTVPLELEIFDVAIEDSPGPLKAEGCIITRAPVLRKLLPSSRKGSPERWPKLTSHSFDTPHSVFTDLTEIITHSTGKVLLHPDRKSVV